MDTPKSMRLTLGLCVIRRRDDLTDIGRRVQGILPSQDGIDAFVAEVLKLQ